jgi:hypothetical protein
VVVAQAPSMLKCAAAVMTHVATDAKTLAVMCENGQIVAMLDTCLHTLHEAIAVLQRGCWGAEAAVEHLNSAEAVAFGLWGALHRAAARWDGLQHPTTSAALCSRSSLTR